MPATYGDFPSAREMIDYLNSYAKHWNLENCIQFNRKVEKVEPLYLDDKEMWRVTFGDGKSVVYKGVVISIGHHWVCVHL